MPFNLTTFKTRSLTAIIFVAIMATGHLLNFETFVCLYIIIFILLVREWIRLSRKITLEQGYGFAKEALVFTTILLFYIAIPLILLIDLGNHTYLQNPFKCNWRWEQMLMPVFLIGCMWINDTMAYIVGSLIGRTPFSSISPKKTWEGTLGGIILSSLIMGYLASIWDRPEIYNLKKWNWYVLAITATVAGTLGDLFESKLKRMANVKDSGYIMPGHGGALDRFDSLLLAIPAVYVVFFIFVS